MNPQSLSELAERILCILSEHVSITGICPIRHIRLTTTFSRRLPVSLVTTPVIQRPTSSEVSCAHVAMLRSLQLLAHLLVTSLLPRITTATETTVTPGEKTRDLYIMGLYPRSGSWQGGESMLTASLMAVRQINSMPDILPGYRLNIIANDTLVSVGVVVYLYTGECGCGGVFVHRSITGMCDTVPRRTLGLDECDPGIGIKVMFHQLFTPPTKMAIMGDGCSIVSEVTARASHLWNLVQVSYLSVSPALSDKAKFPLFARVTAPDTQTNPVRLLLLQTFGWRRVATIHQSYDLFAAGSPLLSGIVSPVKGCFSSHEPYYLARLAASIH
ncbi:hypothetical protein C0Q70_11307 [Pomacea canaliculata]|uniref:Receptor ligand binding region domain-containing protein n=1 Tax=Pomacea canaliculata TaxID=400727 RepID=A0A2T7P5Q2_POMCA|nr:hypothetical protein C0Q70_11307 [Pomacea canaliculata]